MSCDLDRLVWIKPRKPNYKDLRIRFNKLQRELGCNAARWQQIVDDSFRWGDPETTKRLLDDFCNRGHSDEPHNKERN